MGAFLLFDIEFKTKRDRKKFEKKYKILKKKTLVDENVECFGLAWMYLRNVNLNPIYNMGFMGYEEPKIILRECLKEGIKIKFMAWNPINDKDSHWNKIRGRW